MKFVQYAHLNQPNNVRLGYVYQNCVIDVHNVDHEIPKTMLEFLRNDYFWKRVDNLKNHVPLRCHIPLKNVILKAPITGMDKVIGIEFNYKDLCKSYKINLPDVPIAYGKFPSNVIGPNDTVKIRSEFSEKVDWQVELAVVIGRMASFVKAKDAYKYVFGYTIAQDITARDWQKEKNGGQFLLAKTQDTFCPLGPWIVTSDEIDDPGQLDISCTVNNVRKQNSNTSEFVFGIPSIIERLSKVMTLLPGDIILTGTPAGSGMYSHPAHWLRPGDVIVSRIEKIGTLQTTMEKYIKPEEPFEPLRRDLLSVKC